MLGVGCWVLGDGCWVLGDNRNRQRLDAIGCGNDAAVAVGLLLERVVLLYQAMVVAV